MQCLRTSRRCDKDKANSCSDFYNFAKGAIAPVASYVRDLVFVDGWMFATMLPTVLYNRGLYALIRSAAYFQALIALYLVCMATATRHTDAHACALSESVSVCAQHDVPMLFTSLMPLSFSHACLLSRSHIRCNPAVPNSCERWYTFNKGPNAGYLTKDVVAVPGQGSLVYVSTTAGIAQCSTSKSNGCKYIVNTDGSSTGSEWSVKSLYAVNTPKGALRSARVCHRVLGRIGDCACACAAEQQQDMDCM